MTTLARSADMTPSEIVLAFNRELPVRLDDLAREMGIDVVYDSALSDDTSGKIERARGAPSGFRITVNGRHHLRRQRFTLAHEIGHYILHRDLIGDGLTDDGLYRSTLRDGRSFESFREQEANKYAASLLMPAGIVRAQFRAGNCSIAGMAKVFDVSQDAARIRMKELGLGP